MLERIPHLSKQIYITLFGVSALLPYKVSVLIWEELFKIFPPLWFKYQN